MKITIYDIAKELGVSASTVSRGLNESQLIEHDLVTTIQSKAEEMGYTPRRIRKQRERAILNVKLVLPMFQDRSLQLFYDFGELAEAIVEGADPCRVQLIAETLTPDFQPFSHKKGGDVDAFIFAFCEPPSGVLEKLNKHRVPILFLNRTVEGSNYITGDHFSGMQLIVEHLLSRRENMHPVFVQIGKKSQVMRERQAGLKHALDLAGISFSLRRDVLSFSGPDQITESDLTVLLERGVDVFIGYNDMTALCLAQRLRAMGCKTPENVMLTGFDNSPVRPLSYPLITTVDMPVKSFGYRAGEWLVRRVIEREEGLLQLKLDGKLIPGGTT